MKKFQVARRTLAMAIALVMALSVTFSTGVLAEAPGEPGDDSYVVISTTPEPTDGDEAGYDYSNTNSGAEDVVDVVVEENKVDDEKYEEDTTKNEGKEEYKPEEYKVYEEPTYEEYKADEDDIAYEEEEEYLYEYEYEEYEEYEYIEAMVPALFSAALMYFAPVSAPVVSDILVWADTYPCMYGSMQPGDTISVYLDVLDAYGVWIQHYPANIADVTVSVESNPPANDTFVIEDWDWILLTADTDPTPRIITVTMTYRGFTSRTQIVVGDAALRGVPTSIVVWSYTTDGRMFEGETVGVGLTALDVFGAWLDDYVICLDYVDVNVESYPNANDTYVLDHMYGVINLTADRAGIARRITVTMTYAGFTSHTQLSVQVPAAAAAPAPTQPANNHAAADSEESTTQDTPAPSAPASATVRAYVPIAAGTANVRVTVRDNSATLQLPGRVITELINNAEEETVTLDLSSLDDVESIAIQRTFLRRLLNEGLSLEIILPQGTISLSAEAVAMLAELRHRRVILALNEDLELVVTVNGQVIELD